MAGGLQNETTVAEKIKQMGLSDNTLVSNLRLQ